MMMMTAHGDDSDEYHNQFAVQVDGGDDAAEAVAAAHGLDNKGQIGNLPGHYLMEAKHLQKRSAERCQETHSKLESDPKVLWFEQQKSLKRKKRDLTSEL